jgi:hypothetical protein
MIDPSFSFASPLHPAPDFRASSQPLTRGQDRQHQSGRLISQMFGPGPAFLRAIYRKVAADAGVKPQ